MAGEDKTKDELIKELKELHQRITELEASETERERAEEALNKAKSLLDATGKMAKVGGWEFDVETLEQVWTEEVYRIHEVDLDYIPTVGKGIDFYAPESRPIIEQVVQRAIDHGEPFDVELQFITAKGNHRWVHAIGKAHQKDGKTTKVSGTFQDITERKHAEEERERLLAELETKNRELESFVYTVSHDLKAPLVSLDGFSFALQKEFYDQLDEKGRHYLERLKANVAHMDTLIMHLLELSRIGKVVEPIEEIDVSALLGEIKKDLAVKLKKVKAEFVVQEPLPTVLTDRGRIRQVFVNLIDNAVKFRSEERPLRIEVGCQEERGFYCFHVADNGIGIASQYQEQIFAHFQKLNVETEGVGIGLALSRRSWSTTAAASGWNPLHLRSGQTRREKERPSISSYRESIALSRRPCPERSRRI